MALDPDIEAKYVHNGKVMVGSAILLVILILIIILYRTYAHVCARRRRRRHLFPHPLPTTSSSASAATFHERLDPSVLKSLPTFTFSSAAHRPLHDCAVCLSEFEDGDKGRVLPNCSHAFHCHCIDTWFASHSNCPLCRSPVQPVTAPSSDVEACPVSVTEAVEAEVGGCSSLPAPIMCPRKPLGIIVELPEEDRGLDHHRILSLKRFCSV